MQTGYWYVPPHDYELFHKRHRENPTYGNSSQENLVIHAGNTFEQDIKQSSFDEFKSFVENKNIPALFFWGSCAQCNLAKNEIFSKLEMKTFQASEEGQRYGYFNASENNNSDVKEFCRSPSRHYPYIRLYWKKDDGSVVSKDLSRDAFYSIITQNTAQKFVDAIKETFAGYDPIPRWIVSFSANGGSGSRDAVEVEQGKALGLPTAGSFQKLGAKQIGWIIEGVHYDLGSSYTPTGNITVFAEWEDNPVTPDIPPAVDDPTFDGLDFNFSNRRKLIITSQDKFPMSYVYTTNGYKKIQMSNNISSINVHEMIENVGLENQIISASLSPRITTIDSRCFYNCTNLVGINADNNVRRVESYAFYNCHSLQGINFLGDSNQSLQVIGSHAFDGCGFKSIKINHQGSVSESSLDEWCFANNTELTAVQFLKSTYLGAHMFDGCVKLTNIQLNNYHSYVGAYAFANCRSLSRIKIPPNIYMISEHMFDGCINLESIVFENGSQLRQIGDYAFNNCPKLKEIILPASVDDISYLDPSCFAGSSLERVTFLGLDDSNFATVIKKTVNAKYDVGKFYESERDVLKNAYEAGIPVFAYMTNLHYGCGHCIAWDSQVTSKSDFKKWVKEQNFYFVKYSSSSEESSDATAYKFISDVRTALKYTSYSQTAYPLGVLYWRKLDKDTGKQIKIYSAQYGGMDGISATKSVDAITKTIENMFKEWEGTTEDVIVINEELNTFGHDGPLTYVSSSGAEYICTNTSVVRQTSTRVDHMTADNFKYGIWYYNAKQLKKFADDNHVPVLVEWGAKSCDPCRDFKKNTFSNKTFQSEVTNRKCFLCKVELGDGGSFAFPTTTQEYFVSHEWGQYNQYIPQLVYYWNKGNGNVYREVWNYNYRSDPANANYQTVLNKLDTMLASYSPDSAHSPPIVTESSNSKYKYYDVEPIVTTGYTIEAGKYVKPNGTTASDSSYSLITISDVDPTRVYHIYTACDANHCIHAYDADGHVVGAELDDNDNIIGSGIIEENLPTSLQNEYKIYTVSPPSNASTIKISNGHQSTLPLKYRSSYDVDGRFFICDQKTSVQSYSGTIDVDDLAYVVRDDVLPSGPAGIEPINGIQVGQSVSLRNCWCQYCTGDDGSPGSFLDKTGVIFKVYDQTIEDILTFTNEDETNDLNGGDDNVDSKIWITVDDQTGSIGVESILQECQQYSYPLIILESGVAETEFDTKIKNSSQFKSWMNQIEDNWIFVDARSSSWSSNGPKIIKDFENQIKFQGNTSTLPKILVFHGCSSCNAEGKLEVYSKSVIPWNSSWTVEQYTSQIEMYATAIMDL